MNSKRHAFTLVELLVVIGIIALLISILLPALNRARRNAMTVQCSSNMRQIAMAMLAYIQDNKGNHPPAVVFASTEAGRHLVAQPARPTEVHRPGRRQRVPRAGRDHRPEAVRPQQRVPLPGRPRGGGGRRRRR
jgi:prepilin-type N-terminal cleavage/methylation domain-containing protein